MRRQWAGLELGGIREISDELGVARTTASMWAQKDRREMNGFPAPLARLASGPVYDMEEVRQWWSERPARSA